MRITSRASGPCFPTHRIPKNGSSEKRQFQSVLIFAHPDDPGKTLSCTWHGKVSHLTLRLHFSWPVEANKPVYVVYAGSKITKR